MRRLFGFSIIVWLAGSTGCDGGAEDDPNGPGPGAGTAGSSGQGGSGLGGAAGSSGQSGAGRAGAAGGSGAALVIDDFEDGDGSPLIGGGWYTYTDVDNGGASTISIPGSTGSDFVMTGEGYDSERSLVVEYSFNQGNLTYEPYVGFGAGLGSAGSPRNLESYAALAYTYRGGAHTVRIETYDVQDYNFYGASMAASANWKTVLLPFSDFAQESWGEQVAFDRTNISALSFHIRGATGGSARLEIDDLKAVESIPNMGPDMPLNPPAPPPDGVIGSIEIGNPLQAKALRYLTRGYNLTNWLEQGRFAGFTYDEAYVQKLSAAGFKSLRLPIDLDRYVETSSGSGDSLEVTVHEDLFTVLDAFDAWTAAHGLSLTIDYHQYDKSVSMADAASLDVAVAVWGKVAEHFAANPREDLFFELLNEPELSLAAPAPTQAQWTALAERMIGAIRARDTTHTIIFGDVEWYGIGPLSRRTPLSDKNVIYAFHSYEPFIFTHQGASWANMSTTHDIPYPYSVERWSQYYSELGFNRSMEAWILSAARDYYRTGNRSSLRNGVLVAKRWALEHDVPVICNEFGAYDARARLEDRARYYTDLIDIFTELEIPWQQWFMVMDQTGNVIPEYRAAFKLDE